MAVFVCTAQFNLFSQCPSGETELTFTINAPFNFAVEIGWDTAPAAASGTIEGGCPIGAVVLDASTVTQTACFTNNVNYTFNFYDSFGDNWNNGAADAGGVTIAISDDGSVNGQSALQGCPIAIVTPTAVGGGPDPTCSVAESFTFSVDGDATLITGCSNPSALNFNMCVAAADDDGSCIVPPPTPPLAPFPSCNDTLLGNGHDGMYTAGNTASAVAGFSIAEDFSIPSTGDINEVGVQFFFQDALGNFFTTPPTEDFEVIIYTDGGGTPGLPVLGPLTLTNANYVSTQVPGWLIFDVLLDIPDLMVTPGTYWLEVTYLSAIDNAFWILDENSLVLNGSFPLQTDNNAGTTAPIFGNMVQTICFAPATCDGIAGSDGTLDVCSADGTTDISPTDGNPGGTFSPALASGTGLFDPAVDPGGVYTYTVTDPNDPTCMDTADVTVNLTIAPVCNTDCNAGPLETFDSATCSCIADPTPIIAGCTNPSSPNFDPTANCNDGSCAAISGQCYVGSITVGANGGDQGVCFETTYILVDAGGTVVASNVTGEFGLADGAAFNTSYSVVAFTYNLCALGFVVPTIPSTIAALDPSMNCGSLTTPFDVVLKDSNTVACSNDLNAEIRVGFAGWFTGNSQRYILSDANNGSGTILQVNNTGLFPATGLAEGDYYVCAVNFPPADAPIVDGSVGQTLSSIEDVCSSLNGPTSFLTDCTQVSVTSEPTITISLPTELCTQVGVFNLDVWATPPGGVWTDASGATITTFDPSAMGIGSFDLNYTYTDGNGCAGSASTTVNVGDDCLAAGIPTTSEWGLLCLALSLLSVITIFVRRREFEEIVAEA